MAECNQPDGGNAGLVSVFARTPQLCAGAMAGLGSALWLNIVGPCAGLVAASAALALANALAVVLVAVLAMLITAAGSLIAADWRADVASGQAWPGIDIAAAEFGLPVQRAAPSQSDPSYVVTTLGEGLQSAFRAYRIGSRWPGPNVSAGAPVAVSTTGILMNPGPLVPLAAKAVPKLVRNIQTPAMSDGAMARPTYKDTANASLDRAWAVAASRSARPQMLRDSTTSSVRLVAGGDTWSDGIVCDWRVPPDGPSADIVVLCGDRGSDDQRGFPGVSARDGAVGSGEPPSCRGPPTAKRRQAQVTKTVPDGRSADPAVHDNLGHQVPVRAAELDVIETYLDQMLRDLLASSAREPDDKRS